MRPLKRSLTTQFGDIDVSRLAYRQRDVDSRMPLDAELSLPEDLYSYRVRRRIAEFASEGSFGKAGKTFSTTTGVRIPHRQVEELAARAAKDFEPFYATRKVVTTGTTDLLVLQFDAKGVIIRKEELREETKKKAEQRRPRLDKRRSKGEQANLRRMAQLAVVFDQAPFVRSPTTSCTSCTRRRRRQWRRSARARRTSTCARASSTTGRSDRRWLPRSSAARSRTLRWAVDAFRLATSGVRDETQMHTHMCYSEFGDILEDIAEMDADVLSIETSRSKMELLLDFARFRYPNAIGPGVYDIHSPRVPRRDEMVELLVRAADVLPLARLWVNPDCGLKTRSWPEVEAALTNMVEAACAARARLSVERRSV